jgi:chromosome segregation ATPase
MADSQVIRNLSAKYATCLEALNEVQSAIASTQNALNTLQARLPQLQQDCAAAEQALKGAL